MKRSGWRLLTVAGDSNRKLRHKKVGPRAEAHFSLDLRPVWGLVGLGGVQGLGFVGDL